MTSRGWTLIGLAVATIVLLGVETVALLDPSGGDTISEIVWQASDKLPAIPLFFGFLAGHFWFPKGRCAKCGAPKPWVAK